MREMHMTYMEFIRGTGTEAVAGLSFVQTAEHLGPACSGQSPAESQAHHCHAVWIKKSK